MINIHEVSVKDLNTLKDIDLRSNFYPLEEDAWAYSVVDGHCANYGASIGKVMVGFVLAEQIETLMILRLCVRPNYRHHGVGTKLMDKMASLARDLHVSTMSIIIPEIHCLPGDPDDVSLWLKWRGFRATKILKDGFYMYGDKIDGFKFERKV
jgi:ribosomal protein S18 acetylase RimI-like enzyme